MKKYHFAPEIIGTYVLSNVKVNGRDYFTSTEFDGRYGIWYCSVFDSWIIGLSEEKGQCKGYAHIIRSEKCLECLPSWGWRLYTGTSWVSLKKSTRFMVKCLSKEGK